MSAEAVPRTIRIAGVLTSLQAVVGLVFVVALLVRATTGDLGGVGTLGRSATYGEAGYYGVLSLGVLAAGIGLLRGKHWARTPALLLQLLLIGIAWYAAGPSSNPLVSLVIGAPAVAVLWCLFNKQGRVWSWYAGQAPDADSDSDSKGSKG